MRFASESTRWRKTHFVCECVYLCSLAPSARAAEQLSSDPPFPAAAERCAFACVNIDHLSVYLESSFNKLPEQVFPDAAPRPAHEAIINRIKDPCSDRQSAPATAAFRNVHDAADDAAVISPLDEPFIHSADQIRSVPLLDSLSRNRLYTQSRSPFSNNDQIAFVRAKKIISTATLVDARSSSST